MADYIYLLETRLTPAQQRAIATIRTVARDQEYTVFLTGGAVRDMTGGGSIRDLDLTIQGDALALKGALQTAGAIIDGESTAAQRLFLRLPGGVRVEVASAMSVTFPKPGQPEYQPATLTDDLRSRDFTANAMAVSLNEGSYGLLMDPLNGVADIENRELRLVSNYGFIEDPSRLVRAARFRSRLGWQFEERTGQRYETAKEEGYVSALSDWNRGYELEEIFHEEDPVRIMRALESEGWLAALRPGLTAAKANTAALNEVAERQGQLQMQGLFAQSAALTFPMVTAKTTPEDVAALKAQFVRPGFVEEIDTLEARTREFGTRFGGKEAATPSAVWRMLHESEPNLVLSLAYSSKSAALQGRLKTFLNDSPGARQRIPYVLMQEMRITPDVPAYDELVEKLFFELMDNKLSTTEEMKAYLEPYSPPAPPPPVNLRRARAKKEARPSRAKGKKAVEADDAPPTVAGEEEAAAVEMGLMEPGTLTGPNRGPEPTPREPLAGKEAPEPGQIVGDVEPEIDAAPEREAAPAAKKPKASLAPGSKPAEGAEPVVATPQLKSGAKGKPAVEQVAAPKESSPASAAGRAPAAASSPLTAKAPEKKHVVVVAPAKQAPAKPTAAAAPAKAASGKAAPAAAGPAKAVVVAAKGKQTPAEKESKPVASKGSVPVRTVAPAIKAVAKAVPPAGKTAVKTSAPAKSAVAVKAAQAKPAENKAPAKSAVKAPAKVAAKKAVRR